MNYKVEPKKYSKKILTGKILHKRKSPVNLKSELAEAKLRLAEAEDTLRAIRSGAVDAVVIPSKKGPQVFTLDGAEQMYRLLIESMNKGVLTLANDGTIFYANSAFASLIKLPLDQVLGSSFLNCLSKENQQSLQRTFTKSIKANGKISAELIATDGTILPVQISICKFPKNRSNPVIMGVLVSDMTDAKQNEEHLRALTHAIVQAQETERGRVAFELHDGITQLLCGILFRSQALLGMLADQNGPAQIAALKLNEVAAMTVEEVERISRNLRPGILEDLGLMPALREAGAEFSNRTKISVKITHSLLNGNRQYKLPAASSFRLPLDTELVLYRIFQEGLRNVEKHSLARKVKVRIQIKGEAVQMLIQDNGIGFDSTKNISPSPKKGGLGLLSMRERAKHIGGTLKLKSLHGKGTAIEVTIPIHPKSENNS